MAARRALRLSASRSRPSSRPRATPPKCDRGCTKRSQCTGRRGTWDPYRTSALGRSLLGFTGRGELAIGVMPGNRRRRAVRQGPRKTEVLLTYERMPEMGRPASAHQKKAFAWTFTRFEALQCGRPLPHIGRSGALRSTGSMLACERGHTLRRPPAPNATEVARNRGALRA